MELHGLKAANTFNTRRRTWESWGENKVLTSKRVLDYLPVPYLWEFSDLEVKLCFKRGGKKQ
eukprot:5453468-Pyramimonas_sp.AAC.1